MSKIHCQTEIVLACGKSCFCKNKPAVVIDYRGKKIYYCRLCAEANATYVKDNFLRSHIKFIEELKERRKEQVKKDAKEKRD